MQDVKNQEIMNTHMPIIQNITIIFESPCVPLLISSCLLPPGSHMATILKCVNCVFSKFNVYMCQGESISTLWEKTVSILWGC